MLQREAFLEKYGFGKSRGYFVEHNGKPYDSKAIAGAAHGKLGDGFQALSSSAFSGGDRTVARALRELGFTVLKPLDAKPIGVPYEIGSLYHRQRDIHQTYGGQERGSISTPSSCPFVFLFTGESGEQFGYSDGWRPDGIFTYTGEGQSGDMTFVRGNRAIRDHLADGRDLLLFEATRSKGNYRYIGCFAFAGWETVDAPDREGKLRKAIRQVSFTLRCQAERLFCQFRNPPPVGRNLAKSICADFGQTAAFSLCQARVSLMSG